MGKRYVVLGVQWGDEGKGKIVDLLTSRMAAVVRFQGGNNAGHTLIVDGHKTVLRLIPSGIIRQQAKCMLAHGVVVSPRAILEEMDELAALQINWSQRLMISAGCSLILPFHIALDEARELARAADKDDVAIGTTKRGIGPAYEDRVARRGLRMQDLLYPKELKIKLQRLGEYYNFMLTQCYAAAALDIDQVYAELMQQAKRLTPLLGDVRAALITLQQENANIMLEGAQGSLLDIDMGTYPYVTSSNTTLGAVFTGTGLSPSADDEVLGVCKAYATRVGGGPFPTELDDDVGASLARIGGELGAVTQRPRRCGWLDLVALRYTLAVNGVTGLVVTKMDVMDHFPVIKVCTAYRCGTELLQEMPMDPHRLATCEPVYESFKGWQQSTAGAVSWDQLPEPAQHFLQQLAKLTGIPIKIISTGAEREHAIILQDDLQYLSGDRGSIAAVG